MTITPAQIEERLGGWSGMLRHPLRTLWNLRQRETAAQEEADALRAMLAEATEKAHQAERIASIRSALRLPFITAFMDGRNEHGTHLLIMPATNVFEPEKELEILSDDFERIFSDAEKLGHVTGHSIAITLKWVSDPDHGDGIIGGYYTYEAVHELLTGCFFGTADEQRLEMEAGAIAQEAPHG